jgi:hypothetical protein
MICLFIIAALLAVVALVVGVVVLMYQLTPVAPHPDLARINWPVAPDPTITVERRHHDS